MVQAKSSMEEVLKLSRSGGAKWQEGIASIYLGWILAKMEPSDRDVAEEHTLHGITILEDLGLRASVAQGYLLLGEIHVEMGQKNKALENLKKAEGMYREMRVGPESYWLRRTQEAMARL